MYKVIVKQSPELAIRQFNADNNTFPHTSEIPECRKHTPSLELSAETQKLFERVTVESFAYPAALDIRPKNELQRRKLEAIINAGPTYESCLFFQTKIFA